MTLIIVDIITTILQSISFAYVVIYCTDENKKIDKLKLLRMAIVFGIIGNVFVGTFGNNLELSVIITHILSLGVAIVFYRKKIIEAMTAHTIIYFILAVYSILFSNLIFEYVKGIISIEYINYEKIFVIYIPEWIIIYLCFKYINKIKQIYKLLINEKFSINMLIASFFMDFILVFYFLTLGERSQLIKNIAYIIFFMFFIVILIYFWKIHQKSEQIYKLNEALEIKNSELRKIKHDYGAQISYLYGLCLMERVDDLKKSLKDIINNNDSTPTAVEISENEKSLLSLALKPAIDQGIHVILEENCDFSLINMSEIEFYRVVSNIVNNAIKAMNGEGIIIAKSYESLGNAVIKIENNGPKIPEEHLKDIFKAGFTTKENGDSSHGYGLSIVKDLVENSNGKIQAKSTDTATEFKIVLPIKEFS